MLKTVVTYECDADGCHNAADPQNGKKAIETIWRKITIRKRETHGQIFDDSYRYSCGPKCTKDVIKQLVDDTCCISQIASFEIGKIKIKR